MARNSPAFGGCRAVVALLAIALPLAVCAAPARANAGFNDGIDRNAPDFVKASLLVMGPGEQLYSCAGHACFRLECPKFNLDYCFSYEGESASDQIFKFLAGRLKMGMFAVPTKEFLKQYEETGRGVRQYTLNLSPPAKQRLWKRFDDLVAKGPDLPYDYIKRGCAQSTLHTIMAAIPPEPVEFSPVARTVGMSRREILHSYVSDYPWTRVVMQTISGPEADIERSSIDRIITPDDMLVFLRNAKINGKPLLTEEPVELLPQTLRIRKGLVSPMMVAIALAALAVVGFWKWGTAIGALLLAVQTLIGLVEAYIVFFSSLPASSWNWLLVPFNPLPLVFWKWRRRWALPFAVVLAAWVAFMVFSPHMLTDWAYVVLVGGYVAWYVGIWRRKGAAA